MSEAQQVGLFSEGPNWRLFCGPNESILPWVEDCSVDALVTDPPSGIAFLGAEWDKNKGGREQWIEWLAGVMRECYRVMKPGAHGLVWSLPRTSHWTGTALELAGFEIRDRIAHVFHSGFSKNHNLSLDVEEKNKPAVEGLGTALKPAVEDWWLVRKPLDGIIAYNVLTHTTGALRIDDCRVPLVGNEPPPTAERRKGPTPGQSASGGFEYKGAPELFKQERPGEQLGRWPSHLILSHGPGCEDPRCGIGCPVDLMGRQSGKSKSQPGGVGGASQIWGKCQGGQARNGYSDQGTAARYYTQLDYDPFVCFPKPSPSEKNAGLENLPTETVNDGRQTEMDTPYQRGETERKNTHPTVKSAALMAWLCRLITPKGGLVLDPFTGSGSTGIGAIREDLHFVGIEMSPEFCKLATERIKHEQAKPKQLSLL